MQIRIIPDKNEMAAAAAAEAADRIRRALAERGEANLIVATGASQLEMLDALVRTPDIDWSRVTGFHLDEYIGLPITHDASFRKYLKERFVDRLPGIKAFHYVDGESEPPEQECARLGELIRGCTIDLACIGIGENGHIAFNDPPADFKTEEPYIVVELDEACRSQQFNEGWFPSLKDVPARAISMSVRQILKSGAIVCTVPDERKAEALRNSVEGAIPPDVPASILQQHGACTLYTDAGGASRLSPATREQS